MQYVVHECVSHDVFLSTKVSLFHEEQGIACSVNTDTHTLVKLQLCGASFKMMNSSTHFLDCNYQT